jgi:hypothetical protein
MNNSKNFIPAGGGILFLLPFIKFVFIINLLVFLCAFAHACPGGDSQIIQEKSEKHVAGWLFDAEKSQCSGTFVFFTANKWKSNEVCRSFPLKN